MKLKFNYLLIGLLAFAEKRIHEATLQPQLFQLDEKPQAAQPPLLAEEK